MPQNQSFPHCNQESLIDGDIPLRFPLSFLNHLPPPLPSHLPQTTLRPSVIFFLPLPCFFAIHLVLFCCLGWLAWRYVLLTMPIISCTCKTRFEPIAASNHLFSSFPPSTYLDYLFFTFYLKGSRPSLK